jgi:hypothetical protein
MANDIHTRRLAEFLAMDAMGASELKKTVEKTVPRELSYHDFDGKIVNARELLISEGIQGSTLIPTEIYATVMEGTEPLKCMREVLPMVNMKGMALSVPYGEAGTYAPVVAEGAEIPIEDQTYGSVTFTAKKYGVRPLITNEMIDDALFDIVAAEVRKAGSRMENALNRVAIYEMMDSRGNTVANGGTTPLAHGMELHALMIADNVSPTHCIMTPGAYALALDEGFGKVGIQAGIMQSGSIGTFMGLDTRMLGVTAALSPGTSRVWESDTGGDTMLIMLDKSRAGAIGMRQDIKVEQYADSIRQMQGITLSMRFDVQGYGAESAVDAIGSVSV